MYAKHEPVVNRWPGRLLHRAVAAALLVAMTACTTMQPVAVPRQYLQASQPRVIWVTQNSPSTVLAMEGPRLVGDTIVGFVEGEFMELPLSNVKSVQAKQYSRGKTSAFVIGMSAVVVGLFFVLSGGAGSAEEALDENDIGIRRRR